MAVNASVHQDPVADLDLAERLIGAARKAGADQADVLVLGGVSLSIGVANGALEEAERAEQREAGLRVLVGQRQACVSSSDLGDEALAAMAERAVALAREAPDDPWCGLADADATGGHADPATLDLVDRAEPLDPGALEDLASAAEAAALDVPGVTQVEQAYGALGRTALTMAASNGFNGQYARTSLSVGASAIAGSGLGRERDFAGETRHHAEDLPDAAEIGQLAGARAAAMLGPRKPPGGSYPVLFDQRVASSLIGHVLSAVNGTSITRGASWLSDALDTQILPSGMDVVEMPGLVRGAASRPFDAEGIAARTRPIVENGVLRRWILDQATARKLGLASTGNARRGLSAPPSPGVSNIVVTEGDAGRDALLKRMGTGLLVTSLIGRSVNATTGDYSRGAAGFWVENGDIAYPVNEITIAGSLPSVVKTMVPANDADTHRSMAVPSLLVDGLTIGA